MSLLTNTVKCKIESMLYFGLNVNCDVKFNQVFGKRRNKNSISRSVILSKLTYVLQIRCSKKCCEFYRKTPMLEYVLIKMRLQHRCFPVKSASFLRALTFGDCFSTWIFKYSIKKTIKQLRHWLLNHDIDFQIN